MQLYINKETDSPRASLFFHELYKNLIKKLRQRVFLFYQIKFHKPSIGITSQI